MLVFGDKYKLNINKNKIDIKLNNKSALIIALVFKPREYMLIISLSLCNFENDNINPKIITIGNITETKFGIKNIDR